MMALRRLELMNALLSVADTKNSGYIAEVLHTHLLSGQAIQDERD